MWQFFWTKFRNHVEYSPEIHHDDLKYCSNSQTYRRNFTGLPEKKVRCLLVCFTLFLVYLNLSNSVPLSQSVRHCLFLSYVILLIFMLYPYKKSHYQRENHIPWYDLLFALLGVTSLQRYVLELEMLEQQYNLLNLHLNTQMIFGIIGILALAEACRRVSGSSILWVAGFLFLYTMTLERPMTRVIYDIFVSEQGILGAPARVCASYVVLFIIFGAFLEEIRLPDYLHDCAKYLSGGRVGGAAKVAVISSALCGMVSGSSVGNTVMAGSSAIPLMKKYQYPKSFAGAVVASASVGGQMMPPIMGSAAFLMVEFFDIPYGQLVGRALLPAFLYFLGVFFMVHFKAKKLNLHGLPKEELPTLGELLAKSYLLIPLVLLIYLLLGGVAVAESTCYATIISILLGFLDKAQPLDHKRIFQALESACRMILPVSVACCMAGVISGIVTSTGLGQFLISAVVSVSGDEIFVALLATMLCSLLLGMMVPTIANYVIMATIGAPILIYGMGVDVILANMFVFYFGILSDITPPVSMASYAAAAIAKGKYLKTACTATTLSMSAFLIPYLFMLHPALLLVETTLMEVFLLVLTASAGMFAVSAGVMGYLFAPLGVLIRLLAVLSGFLLVYPETYSDIVGLVGISLLIFQQKITIKQE